MNNSSTKGEYLENWISQARKGLVEYAVILALRDRERYGYDLVKELVDIPGLSVKEGTIYPILSRLRLQGLIRTRLEESPEGPARKYYSLTEEGFTALKLMTAYMKSVDKGLEKLK